MTPPPRAPSRRLTALTGVLAAAALALPTCGDAGRTAVRLFLDLDASLAIDQVRLQALSGETQILSIDVPQTPRGPIARGQDVVILFEDRLGGTRVELLAAGLAAGAEKARGQVTVQLAAGATVETFVTLAPSAGCPAGMHACGASCYADDDVAHCGLSCLSCAAPSHGTATCTGNACSFTCDRDYTRCGSECVDLTSDVRACGACATPCAANQICQDGKCVLNSCPDGQHACSGTCVPDRDPATCGTRCTPCPDPPNGDATCDGTACGITCAAGFHACSGACVSNTSVATCGARCTPCPTVPNADVACDGTSCSWTCKSGFHACSNACVSDTSPDSCGDSCLPCPAPPDHAVATCNGASCGYQCVSGYTDCGGWCQVTGQSCDVCPPCGSGQYCYPAAGVCYTPGLCEENRDCVSNSCANGMCTCSSFPPAIGCRPHEQCIPILEICYPLQ